MWSYEREILFLIGSIAGHSIEGWYIYQSDQWTWTESEDSVDALLSIISTT